MNEVEPARHSQLAPAVCTAQLAPDGGSLSLVVAKLPHVADENYEGLQRTPDLESSTVTTAIAVLAGAFQLFSSSYHKYE